MSEVLQPWKSACGSWVQGDLFLTVEGLTETSAVGVGPCSPIDVVLLTQTCDAIRENRELVQVAPIVGLEPSAANEARLLKRPRYVELPNRESPDDFGDLDRIMTVTKEHLVRFTRVPASKSSGAARRLADQISRKWGRFPFPDEVDRVLKPMARNISKAARNEGSHLGAALRAVQEIRVEADWSATPLALQILFIVKPASLPTLAEDQMKKSVQLQLKLESEVGRNTAEYARRLREGSDDPGQVDDARLAAEEKHAYWALLAASIADWCDVGAAAEHVSMVDAEAISTDVITYARILRSEKLDLDALCPDPREMTSGGLA
ncbi:MAG: hypothetical protein QM628_17350 [Propionicimonas sp.]